MLSFAFWTLFVLIVFTLLVVPVSAHKRVDITSGTAALSAALTTFVVWTSVALFQRHSEPSGLVWAAMIYMVGTSIAGLIRVFARIGRSTYYSNAYMAWVVVDSALSIAALFILRG